MAVRGITYEEGTAGGYKSVDISYHKNDEPTVRIFDSGNFIKDWYDAVKWYLHADLNEHVLVNSSSVDHFIMDGAPYDSAYLIPAEGNTQLSYEYQEDRLEFFVPRGTKPTWEEMKVKYDDEYKKS